MIHSEKKINQSINDSYGRPLHDLRISVIDRCNFRCTYCMPEEEFKHYKFLDPGNWLTFEEVERLTALFIELGVKKVRLTGGEPLIRPKLSELVERLARFPEIDDLALTTNGSLLSRYAVDLKRAGLKRLTISLDTLDPKIFKELGGKKADLDEVLEGLQAAESAGFERVKINVVIKKGINDHTVLELVRKFKGTGHILRFIEFMDVGNCNHWDSKFVVPSKKILEEIQKEYPLQSAQPNYRGEVAKRYLFQDGSGEVGFISSVTQPFCGDCSRARLSTDGKLYTCLFSGQGTDLQTPLRTGASDQELLEMIQNTWKKREDRYSEERSLIRGAEAKANRKVEMFQIGG